MAAPLPRSSAADPRLVREFADMLSNRNGAKLLGWSVQSRGRRRPGAPRVAPACASSGPPHRPGYPALELKRLGHVNRIKMIKRQMYGRARPDLLRKRVLLAD